MKLDTIFSAKRSALFVLAIVLLVAGIAALSYPLRAQESPHGLTKVPLANVDASFTYQGEIEDGSGLVDGSCDFRFGLWDDAGAGSQLGSTQFVNGVLVVNGRFTTTLNDGNQFGANAFNGAARWLQIDIRCPAGSGNYTSLSPRQELTPTPYAQSLRPGAVVSGAIPGQMLTAVNPAGDGVAGLSSAANFSGVYGQSDHVDGFGVYGRNTISGTLAYLGGSDQAIYAEAPDGDGLHIGRAGLPSTTFSPNYNGHGVVIKGAEGFGLYVGRADWHGLLVNSSAGTGLAIQEAGNNGVHIVSAVNNGVSVLGAGNIGMDANTTATNGEWGFYTNDKSHSSNYTFSSLSLIVQVGTGEALVTGDLVSVLGKATPVAGSSIRMPVVQLADKAFPNVVGVVEKRMELVPEENYPVDGRDITIETLETQYIWRQASGAAGEGDYVSLTIYGIADVKIDPQTASHLQVGQKLAAGNDGKARILKDVMVDGVLLSEGAPTIGYVLDAPEVGATAVPIFVTLR